jgi:hypothetical protein
MDGKKRQFQRVIGALELGQTPVSQSHKTGDRSILSEIGIEDTNLNDERIKSFYQVSQKIQQTPNVVRKPVQLVLPKNKQPDNETAYAGANRDYSPTFNKSDTGLKSQF